MAINDGTGRRVCLVRDILREFLGHIFVSGLRTLKPEYLKKLLKTLKPKNLKLILKT